MSRGIAACRGLACVPALKVVCSPVHVRECVCIIHYQRVRACTCAYAYISEMCVHVRVADSPVGLSQYGLAVGEVAEQTQRGLSCLLTWPVRGFLALLPTLLLWQMDPLGTLATRSTRTFK